MFLVAVRDTYVHNETSYYSVSHSVNIWWGIFNYADVYDYVYTE